MDYRDCKVNRSWKATSFYHVSPISFCSHLCLSFKEHGCVSVNSQLTTHMDLHKPQNILLALWFVDAYDNEEKFLVWSSSSCLLFLWWYAGECFDLKHKMHELEHALSLHEEEMAVMRKKLFEEFEQKHRTITERASQKEKKLVEENRHLKDAICVCTSFMFVHYPCLHIYHICLNILHRCVPTPCDVFTSIIYTCNLCIVSVCKYRIHKHVNVRIFIFTYLLFVPMYVLSSIFAPVCWHIA